VTPRNRFGHDLTVGAYVRVSSASQTHASQVHAIKQAAAARGDTIGAWYGEKESGRKLARPELERLRADVRAGRVRRLYVYRLDRLTRSGIRDTLTVLEELERHGCTVRTVADGFDLEGPARDVVVAVMAWAAQMEREGIGERIRAARERMKAKGQGWGRPSRMTGADRERAVRMRAAGRTIRQIAAALKVPRSTLARALSASPKGKA